MHHIASTGNFTLTEYAEYDKNATVVKITTLYQGGVQKVITELTTYRCLEQNAYSRRKPNEFHPSQL